MKNSFLELKIDDLVDIELINRWLPPKIIDFHFHCQFRQKSQDLVNPHARIPGETFNCFPWSDHRRLLEKIFPKIDYRVVAFGFPFSANEAANNRLLVRIARRSNKLIPMLTATTDSEPDRAAGLLKNNYSGLKMYPTRGQKQSGCKITDVFPEKILRIINELSLPVIVHLPKNIFYHLGELLGLANAFPRIIFVIAHMGNIYSYQENIGDIFTQLAQIKNVMFDTAMVCDTRLIAEAISILGGHRIIWGSDAPFSYLRGRYHKVPGVGIRLQTQQHFSWVEQAEYDGFRSETEKFKIIHIEIILAIKRAIETVTGKKRSQLISDIFFGNAHKLLERSKNRE